jgi:putative endonuclease
MIRRQPAVYILAGKRNGTLYIGVTSDLLKRCWEHKNNLVDGFTKQYGVHQLAYFELHRHITEAITREKQLKKWNRAWKLKLIQKHNPDWKDLWQEIASMNNERIVRYVTPECICRGSSPEFSGFPLKTCGNDKLNHYS